MIEQKICEVLHKVYKHAYDDHHSKMLEENDTDASERAASSGRSCTTSSGSKKQSRLETIGEDSGLASRHAESYQRQRQLGKWANHLALGTRVASADGVHKKPGPYNRTKW